MEVLDCQHSKRRDKLQHEYDDEHAIGRKDVPSNPAASPPSPASSPAHEFSFTISLQPSSSLLPTTSATSSSSSSSAARIRSTANNIPDKSKSSSSSSFAVDLSPADEIFFHGHLLPLHLLSHLPVSPRSSTNSLDSFTLPIKDLCDQDQNSSSSTSHSLTSSSKNTVSSEKIHRDHIHNNNVGDYETKGRPTKSKSFSLFGLSSKWRKENVGAAVDAREKEEKERQKRKLKLDHVSHVLKRYMRMVRPLLSFGNKRGNHPAQFHRQAFSYSGNLSLRRKPELIGRRGEFSAPASMRTSPTNSGLLVAGSGTLSPSCSTSDSTMEELQAAIQAAIAHCKNSIAVEDKIKCHE